MYCTNCGFKIDDNAVFCSNCGRKVGMQDPRDRNVMNDFADGYNNIMSKPKSKVVAAVLAILLGSLGIHEFYLGYTKKGITHLLMFVFFLSFFSQLWAIYEALMILTGKVAYDGNGVPLTD